MAGVFTTPATAQRPPTLEQVLARAATYVAEFHEQLSGIVAEETYRQRARSQRSRPVEQTTTLQSDFLLVRPPHADRHVEFRDVFAVDDVPVRDRQERLTKLFLTPSPTASAQMRAIIAESARHNIGDIPRNINTPLLPLFFLLEEIQPRFKFTRVGDRRPSLGANAPMSGGDEAVFRVTTEIWVVEYRETKRPTIIRTNNGRDFAATGRFWVEPDSGAVRISELVMRSTNVSANIAVSYQSEPLLGFLVPVEMRERYQGRVTTVEGTATYGKFRQFQVKTGETIGKPPGPI